MGSDPIIFNDDSGLLGPYTLHNTLGNDYDTATGIWTCGVAGNYQFGITASLQQVNNTGVSAVYGTAQCMLFKKVGSVIDIKDGTFIKFDYTPPGFSGSTSVATSVAYTSMALNCDVGDEFYWGFIYGRVRDTANALIYYNSNGSNINIVVAVNSAFSLIPQSNLIYGDTIDMNSLLPNDIKQTDFIMGLCKMFNLYIEQTEDKKLLIEPREDYLTSDIIDWTTKIDIGQDVTYTPMGMNQQKRYKFTCEEDGDWLNVRYKKDYQEVYGTHLENITTDFLTETKEIKPIFAATPLSNPKGGKQNRIISDIRFADPDGANVKSGQTKLRILYWGGLIDCVGSWEFKEQISSGTGASYTTYPYAGHLDNPYTPAFDLNYGLVEAIYYDNNIGANGNVNYTDANLFNTYWYQTIKEFTNRNSKILEAWFYLSVFDFVTLSFRKQYFIRNAYYRLLEVSDYDISGTQLVKCKLLKVSREAAFVPSSKPVYGGNGVFDAGGKIPTKNLPPVSDGTAERTDKGYDGSNGYNTGQNSQMYGSNNTIPDSAPDSYIFGSDGVTVTQERSFVFNSDDLVLSRPGAVFNNVFLEYKQDTEVTAAYLQTIDGGTPLTIIPTLATNEYYQITNFFLVIGAGTTNYTWLGSGDITLDSAGNTVGTILGTAWLSQAEGVIAKGTVAASQDFGDDITIAIAGNYSAGDRAVRIVIFYKIIQV